MLTDPNGSQSHTAFDTQSTVTNITQIQAAVLAFPPGSFWGAPESSAKSKRELQMRFSSFPYQLAFSELMSFYAKAHELMKTS